MEIWREVVDVNRVNLIRWSVNFVGEGVRFSEEQFSYLLHDETPICWVEGDFCPSQLPFPLACNIGKLYFYITLCDFPHGTVSLSVEKGHIHLNMKRWKLTFKRNGLMAISYRGGGVRTGVHHTPANGLCHRLICCRLFRWSALTRLRHKPVNPTRYLSVVWCSPSK